MTVTTLPFMEAIEQEDSARAPGWYVIECQICPWQSHGGALHVCEDEASEHLETVHPRRLIGARELERELRLAINTHGYDSPQVTRLFEQMHRRGM